MEAWVATVALLLVMGYAVVLLSRAWVRSSRLGGYGAAHRSDGLGHGPQVPEDDDVRWHWGNRTPER